MKIISVFLMILGTVFIIGTAGASDINPHMSMNDIDIGIMNGVICFFVGYIIFPKAA